ncbi:VOC family protein [Zhihengliuella sp.]|uniref:VOC family protein n=1 Tax=Zhihengliuella sp. TaxID=1954483 RepID=UPI0028121A8A|nr:VOC family protein [Zhihengliuella sp.]
MKPTLQLVLDCADPHELAAWWAETLEWEVEPSNEDFIRRMIADGHATEADTREFRGTLVWREMAALREPGGPGRILFQLVPEPKTVKNRMHLDLHLGPDGHGTDQEGRDRARDGLVARGATFLYSERQGPFEWHTLADPEGNEFCVA